MPSNPIDFTIATANRMQDFGKSATPKNGGTGSVEAGRNDLLFAGICTGFAVLECLLLKSRATGATVVDAQ
jgi:hypothetical protein